MSRVCALQAVIVYLQTALAMQSSRLAVGDYEALPWLEPLLRLMGYIRLGVCAETRVLDKDELPDLQPLLAPLPLPIRTRLELLIKEEWAGQSAHTSCAVGQLVRELTQARPLPLLQGARSA